MSRLLFRLGHGAAAHPWRTISAWLVLAAAVLGLAAAFGGTPHDDYDVPAARAQVGIEQLRDHQPGAGDASARVVVHNRSGAAPDALQLRGLTARLAAMDHVVTVSLPVPSADGDTALYTITYDVPVTDADLMGNLTPLETAVAPARAAGLQVELGGEVPESAAAPMEGRGEAIGLAAALVILVLAFGSVVAAGLPLLTAIVGLAVGSGGVTLLAATMDVSTAAPTVATMVGLGVGIDYALLLASRHIEHLRAGHSVTDAAGHATATAGRSVVFAASTVLVSLMGLPLAGLPVYSSFGFATAIAVLAVLAASLTLVPALCRLAGRRMLSRRVRRGRTSDRTPLTTRWASRVGRRPLPWAIGAAVLMLTLAVPALDMRTWPQDPSTQSSSLTTRRAFDLVSAEYGPGANGPLLVVADRTKVTDAAVAAVAADLAARADIVAVTPATTSHDGALALLQAQPAFAASDARTGALVESVRAGLPSGVELTGGTAVFADISDLLAGRLWLVIAFVVAVSVLLLAMVFRSVVIPVKAAVMNLLSIAAAYGVMTAVFQWGWGTGLLGLDHAVPVSSWVPILMFAILFGLSMDYEVFLLSRIREEWLATGDPRASVVHGLSSTGRVISSAAAIMVAVFLGFASEVDVVVKMLGVGMAVAVFLDATVVRMVLVPATMSLLGRLNWWLPAWLDRLLPTIDTEGHAVATPQPGYAAGPASTAALPSGRAASAARAAGHPVGRPAPHAATLATAVAAHGSPAAYGEGGGATTGSDEPAPVATR
ncbi:membrane protein [Intrasporangium oryzae NRRL B-24470]|uniref:Membrane protein n=1 Tax=Intrasporangium oryzae NRRL B-24470 TaxID=1386089 RepID=W9GBP9_9MICO|nr:MMPL family transporter [Intrasporangium oryzae]EWT01294.1 membrane protein [Intrasporangium oryzae NRRL B-24470]